MEPTRSDRQTLWSVGSPAHEAGSAGTRWMCGDRASGIPGADTPAVGGADDVGEHGPRRARCPSLPNRHRGARPLNRRVVR